MQEPTLLIDAWPATDKGQAREYNEDFVAVHEPDNPQVTQLSGSLYVIADGAGGVDPGQQASRYAALKVIYQFYRSAEIDLGVRLRKAVQDVNGELYRYSESHPAIEKSSSTIVAVAIRGEQFYIASVGDSRAYLIRDGQNTLLTRDHTLVAQMVERQEITPAEATQHPQRNVLLRSLGSQPTVEVDLYDGRLTSDDKLILATKGLSNHLDDEAMVDVVLNSQSTAAAERLVKLANEQGGQDNITTFVLSARTGIPTPRTPLPFAWDGHEPHLGVEHHTPIPPPASEETQRIPTLQHPSQPPSPPAPAPIIPTAPPPDPYQPIPEPLPPAPTPAPPPPAQMPAPSLQPAAYSGEPMPQGGQPRTYRPPGSDEGSGRGGGRNILIVLLAVIVLAVAGVIAAFTLLPLLNLGQAQQQAEPQEEPSGDAPVVIFTALPDGAIQPPPTFVDPGAAGVAPVEPTQQITPPGMVLVEVGEFLRGASEDEITLATRNCIQEGGGACPTELFDDATPQQAVTLGGFYIDRTEVTNAQYALCVAAGGCDPPTDVTRYDDAAYTNHPVTRVTWAQSSSYCGWAGKRLPTEAEWEKAARGQESRVWPWGDTWEPGKANTSAARLNGPSTVESFSGDVSPYGLIGMAGNVSEWVQDWYQGDYNNLASVDPQGPLVQPGTEPIKVARGGSYRSLSSHARSAMRLDVNSGQGADWLGFRCALSIGAATNLIAPDAEPAASPPEPTNTPTPTSEPAA